MLDLLKLVELECKIRGIERYSVKPVQVEITSPYQYIGLDKYLYLFVSDKVDTPALPTRVDLQSPDNLYQFTKTTLENTTYAKYQFFSDELIVNVRNYGSDKESEFVPFMLEFLKVIPDNK